MRRAPHLLGSLLLAALAVNGMSLNSRLSLLIPLVALCASLAWFTYGLLYLGPERGWLYRRRKELLLALGSAAGALVIAVVGSALTSAGMSPQFRRVHYNPQTRQVAQADDPELSWAPAGPIDVVGERLQKVDPAKPHVVFIGDSIVYGLHLEEKDTTVSLLNEIFPSYQFLNAGVSGYSIEQYWIYLRRILPVTKPKLIFVGLFAGNDVQLTGREYTPWGRSKPLFHVENGELVKANRAERCADAISKSLLFTVVWHSKDIAVKLVKLLCNPAQLARGELEASIAKLFDAIEALGKKSNAHVVWVILPLRWDVAPTNGIPEQTNYVLKYGLLKRLLHEGHHDVLDFAIDLRKSKADLSKVFQEDNGHLTALGQRMLADSIRRYIEEHHLLP